MADTPTPSTPTTLAPVPGQSTSTSSTSTNGSTAAGTTNDFAIPTTGTGKIYTKGTTVVTATPAATIATALAPDSTAGQKGDKGDKGDPGPAGPAGPAGTVDYTQVQAMIDAAIAKALNLKIFRFTPTDPTQVYGGNTIQLPVEIYDQIKLTTTVVTPTSYVVGDANAGTITPQGAFTGAAVTADKQVTITANYTDSQQTKYTATYTVTVKAFLPVSLSLTGPSTIASGGTGTYALVVRYTDNSTKTVTTDAGTTWSLSSASLGTLAVNVLTGVTLAAGVTSPTGNIQAKYVEKGVTLNATLPITVTAPAVVGVKPFYGSAAHPITTPNGGAFTDPTTYAGWDAFVNALASRATNSSRDNVFTITQAPGQYGWYAYPKTYGLMTQAMIKGATQPGTGGWDSATDPNTQTSDYGGTGPMTVSVTISGVKQDFYLYRTDQPAASTSFTETWTVTG